MYIPTNSKLVLQPERRWSRIVQLCDTDGAVPSPPGDDEWVVRGYKFLRELREADGDEDKQRRVSNFYPTLYEAYTLRKVANPTTRAAIEGLITSRVTLAKIAEQYGISPTVLEWYTKLWYDTGSLSNLQVTTVLVPEVHNSSFTADNLDALYKWMGSLSSQMLTSMLELRGVSEDVRSQFEALYRNLLQMKATKAIATVPVKHYNALELMEQHQNYDRDVKDHERASGAGAGQLSEMMQLMLRAAAARWRLLNPGEMPPDLHDPSVNLLEHLPAEGKPS